MDREGGEYVPAVQFEHCELPLTADLPGGQAVHVSAVVVEYWLAGHAVVAHPVLLVPPPPEK